MSLDVNAMKYLLDHGLIVVSRDVPVLISEVERLRKALEEIEGYRERFGTLDAVDEIARKALEQ